LSCHPVGLKTKPVNGRPTSLKDNWQHAKQPKEKKNGERGRSTRTKAKGNNNQISQDSGLIKNLNSDSNNKK